MVAVCYGPTFLLKYFIPCYAHLTGAVVGLPNYFSKLSGFEDHGTWRVISRNGARGIPVRKGDVGWSNVWAGKPCCDAWSHQGWTKLSVQQALPLHPPLDLEGVESADSVSLSKVADDARHFTLDSSGVWRGTMLLGSRVRLDFVPPEKGRAVLGIFLCDSGEARGQCAVTFHGSFSAPCMFYLSSLTKPSGREALG